MYVNNLIISFNNFDLDISCLKMYFRYYNCLISHKLQHFNETRITYRGKQTSNLGTRKTTYNY